MFHPELFECVDHQEFYVEYCTDILELLEGIDRYLSSVDNKLENISDDSSVDLVPYVDRFIGDIETNASEIRDYFDVLLEGTITYGDIIDLKILYEDMSDRKIDIECCLKEYEKEP